MPRHIQRLALVIFFLQFVHGAAWAEVPRNQPPPKNTLGAVLERIRGHAESNDWQRAGFKDDEIETWLDKLITAIATAADLKDLKLPVRLADVKPGDPRLAREGTLVVGQDLNLIGLHKSIVLADGNVEISTPQDCVIVARGVVKVSSSRRCVIVSGMYVSAMIDGEPLAHTGGSLIVSRGWANVRSAYSTMIAAQEGATVGMVVNGVFINGPVPAWDRGGSKSVKVLDLPLEPMPVHPLSTRLRLLGVVQAEMLKAVPAGLPIAPRSAVQTKGVVLRFDDRRYVADLGEPIVDEAGKPVEGLRDWRLKYGNEHVAVFAKGATEMVVRSEEK